MSKNLLSPICHRGLRWTWFFKAQYADATCRSQGADKSSDFKRIREMDAAFDKFAFPQDEHSSFSSTCIYWRKNDVDTSLDLGIGQLNISDTVSESPDNNSKKTSFDVDP